MFHVAVPPVKSQGIKTKLIPRIASMMPSGFSGRWIEPFMGTGVVGFNLAPASALMCDTNPHLINFYQGIADGEITAFKVRAFLQSEGKLLLQKGEDHYYYVRDRFNQSHSPMDFLFLNRACFNGMIRFNRKGEFNVPFCRKPERFAQAYITKIVNQVEYLSRLFKVKSFEFLCQDFTATITGAEKDDIIYADPPYIDRHADYYNGWCEDDELLLFRHFGNTPSRFILSTWHHNDYRTNSYIEKLWNTYNVYTQDHFYHVGAKEANRRPMVEALVMNYLPESIVRDDYPHDENTCEKTLTEAWEEPTLFDWV